MKFKQNNVNKAKIKSLFLVAFVNRIWSYDRERFLIFHKRKRYKKRERGKMVLKTSDILEFINKTESKFSVDYIVQVEKFLKIKGYESVRILGAG